VVDPVDPNTPSKNEQDAQASLGLQINYLTLSIVRLMASAAQAKENGKPDLAASLEAQALAMSAKITELLARL